MTQCLGDQWRPCLNCAGHGCAACDGRGERLVHEHGPPDASSSMPPGFTVEVLPA